MCPLINNFHDWCADALCMPMPLDLKCLSHMSQTTFPSSAIFELTEFMDDVKSTDTIESST